MRSNVKEAFFESDFELSWNLDLLDLWHNGFFTACRKFNLDFESEDWIEDFKSKCTPTTTFKEAWYDGYQTVEQELNRRDNE